MASSAAAPPALRVPLKNLIPKSPGWLRPATSKVLPHLPESTGGGQGRQPWEGWAPEFSRTLFFLQIKVLLAQALRKCCHPPPLLPPPPHSFLCCWQSHMVTSHPPYGPLPWALPGPEGAFPGFRLCAGCRTWGTRGLDPAPFWVARVASAPSDGHMSQVQCPSPPLPRAECPGPGASRQGIRATLERPTAFFRWLLPAL